MKTKDLNNEQCRQNDTCDTDRLLCEDCKHHPKYKDVPVVSLFQEYIPVCLHGYKDCVNDPAYIKYHYPKWYKELYGDLTPEEASKQSCEDDGCYYDDEDK